MFGSVIVLLCVLQTICADQLLLVQSLFRHGDRSPTYIAPKDPYQIDAWQVALGELTTLGMAQHYGLGLKLKQRYIDELRFLNPFYNSSEIRIYSDDYDRTIASAQANLAGLYSTPADTHPDIHGWPCSWTPIPIHAIAHDQLWNIAEKNCPRIDELYVELALKRSFLEYFFGHSDLIALLSEHSGVPLTKLKEIEKYYDSLVCERAHNFTMPAWLTQQVFDNLTMFVGQSQDFLAGFGGFGEGEETELIMLRGGNMLKQMIADMQTAINCDSNPSCINTVKYIAYSAHDTNVLELLGSLGAKRAVLDYQNPDYASTIVLELWKSSDGGHDVQVRYLPNANADFSVITRFVTGCQTDDDFCQFELFYRRSLQYMPSDIHTMCKRWVDEDLSQIVQKAAENL